MLLFVITLLVCLSILLLIYIIGRRMFNPNVLGLQSKIWIIGDYNKNCAINGMLLFKENVDEKCFFHEYKTKFCSYQPFRQALVDPNKSWLNWFNHIFVGPEYDPKSEKHFNPNNHMSVVTLKDPKDKFKGDNKIEFEELISNIVSQPFDMKKPLWCATLIKNYYRPFSDIDDEDIDEVLKTKKRKPGSIVYVKFHHACADGVAGLSLLLAMSKVPKKTFDRIVRETKQKQAIKERKELKNIFSFSEINQTLFYVFNSIKDIVSSAVILLLRTKDYSNLFTVKNKCISGKMKISILDQPIPLKDLKDGCTKISKLFNKKVSLNDLLISSLTVTIHKVLKKYDEAKLKGESILRDINREFKTVVWINSRGVFLNKIVGELKSEELYSDISAFMAQLPVHNQHFNHKSELNIVKMVQKETDYMKKSFDPIIIKYAQQLISLLPKPILQLLWTRLAYQSSISMSNVPGPNYDLIHCGSNVDKVIFCVTPQEKLSSFFCVLSYNNKVNFGIAMAKDVFDKPEEIIKIFRVETLSLLQKIDKEYKSKFQTKKLKIE